MIASPGASSLVSGIFCAVVVGHEVATLQHVIP